MNNINMLLYGANKQDREDISIITYYFSVNNTPIGVKLYVGSEENNYDALLRESCEYASLYYARKGGMN